MKKLTIDHCIIGIISLMFEGSIIQSKVEPSKDFSVREGPAAYQLVGEVTAHQDDDG